VELAVQDQSGQDRQRKIDVVERFLDGLRKKDMSSVPFAPDVVLKSPLTHPNVTAANASEFRRFLADLLPKLPPVKHVSVRWHMVEGDQVVTLWQWVLGSPEVVMMILDHFTVRDDQITLVEPFFDPTPLLDIMARPQQ
jgi:hypothetical protein